MGVSIKIFDPNDKPYGPLSNRFNYPLFIAKKGEEKRRKYRNVDNFIYANILSTPLYNTAIALEKPHKVYETFVMYTRMEQENIVKNALQIALDHKFDNDERLKKMLLSTGNRPLVYLDDNKFLGWKDGDGENIYGKYLERLRYKYMTHITKKEQGRREEEKLEELYRNYIAYKMLDNFVNKYVNSDDFFDKISILIDKNNSEDIIKEVERISDNSIMPPSTTFEMFKSMYIKKTLFGDVNIAIHDPTVALYLVLQSKLNFLERAKSTLFNNGVFNIYTDYILKTKYDFVDENDYAAVKNQQLSVASERDYNINVTDLKRRVIDLYNKNGLPPEAKTNIDKYVSDIVNKNDKMIDGLTTLIRQINKKEDDLSKAGGDSTSEKRYKLPTKRQFKTSTDTDTKPRSGPPLIPEKIADIIKNIDQYDKDRREYEQREAEKQAMYMQNRGQPIMFMSSPSGNETIDMYFELGPYAFTNFYKVVNFIHPTIMHYILYSQFLTLPGITVNQAYALLLANPAKVPNTISDFKDPMTIGNDYARFLSQSINTKKIEMAETALRKKFENGVMQDILVSTGDMELICIDYNDLVLGKNDKNEGDNITGRIMMDIRSGIVNARKDEDKVIVNPDDIYSILRNSFVRSWIIMRLRDTCTSINFVRNYLYKKYEIEDVKRTEKFVHNVITYVYQPCYEVFKRMKNVELEPSDEFITYVKMCPGFKDTEMGVASQLWRRIVVMLTELIKLMKTTPTINDINVALAQLEFISANEKCDVIADNDFENCALLSLINVIKRLKIYNTKSKRDSDIDEEDVKVATNIILGVDLSEFVNFVDVKLPDQKELFDEEIKSKSESEGEGEEDEVEKVMDYGEFEMEGMGEFGEEGEGEVDEEMQFFPEIENEFGIDNDDEEKSEVDYGEVDDDLEEDAAGAPQSRKKRFVKEKNRSLKNNLAMVEKIREEFSDETNLDSIIGYIFGAIDVIKAARIPRVIKSNRLSFFSND